MTYHPGLVELLGELAAFERHDPRNELVRLAARLRARNACEYCLLPSSGEFHIDHIIPPALWSDYAAGRLPVRPEVASGRDADHLDNFA